jgi:HTH-type transcriptional regulator / antitoxin HigA
MTMEIKPIKNERDYRRVMREIDALMDAKANTVAGDRLDVLATLAEAWEEKHYPIEAPDPIEAIRFAMEQRGLNRHDLEPYIGSRARVAEVLNHKRSLTLPMIRRLHDGLGIPAEVLIRDGRLPPAG